MISTKSLIYFILIFVFAFSTTFFIIKSNDHKECLIIKKSELDKNGNKVEVEEHICKEKYAF